MAATGRHTPDCTVEFTNMSAAWNCEVCVGPVRFPAGPQSVAIVVSVPTYVACHSDPEMLIALPLRQTSQTGVVVPCA